MGRNINEFIVQLEFNDAGEVTAVIYWDQEGCGHRREIDEESKVVNLVDYHLAHYRKSHRMEPPKRCPMQMTGVDPDSRLPMIFRCTLEPHDSNTKHQMEQD